MGKEKVSTFCAHSVAKSRNYSIKLPLLRTRTLFLGKMSTLSLNSRLLFLSACGKLRWFAYTKDHKLCIHRQSHHLKSLTNRLSCSLCIYMHSYSYSCCSLINNPFETTSSKPSIFLCHSSRFAFRAILWCSILAKSCRIFLIVGCLFVFNFQDISAMLSVQGLAAKTRLLSGISRSFLPNLGFFYFGYLSKLIIIRLFFRFCIDKIYVDCSSSTIYLNLGILFSCTKTPFCRQSQTQWTAQVVKALS